MRLYDQSKGIVKILIPHLSLCADITVLNLDKTLFHEAIYREKLEAILKENSPPSFLSIAKRFEHNREFLGRKFPELSAAITLRHQEYVISQREEKSKTLQRLIKKALIALKEHGQYASEDKVRKIVKENLPVIGKTSNFKKALREVKEELGFKG